MVARVTAPGARITMTTSKCSSWDCPFHQSRVEDSKVRRSNGSTDGDCGLNGIVQPVRFTKGAVLFDENQPSLNLYALQSGMVKISSHDTDGREQIVGLAHPGKLLVGLQSLTRHVYSYSATAATPVRACRINHHALLDRAEADGAISMALLRSMNEQLGYSRLLMRAMGHRSAEAKIAALILLLVPRSQRGSTEFSLPFSRREVASMLNLSEETVCRVMARLRRDKVIQSRRGYIQIDNLEHLRLLDAAPVAVSM